MPLDPKPLTIHQLGAKNPFVVTLSDKPQITVAGLCQLQDIIYHQLGKISRFICFALI